MHLKPYKLWPALLILGLFLGLSNPILAQDELAVNILNQNIESDFGNYIAATLSFETEAQIEEVEFFYSPATNRTPTRTRNVAELTPGSPSTARFSIDQNETYFPPGVRLNYWWRLTDTAGNRFETERQQFTYLDNRHNFNTLSNERITLYWYSGNDDFGQTLFNAANNALIRLEEDFGASLGEPVQAFIYNGPSELREALGPGSNEWTGGVAYSDYGVIAMGVTPSSLDWGLRATTHELAHLVIHQVTANPYGDLPRWLDEGLAVYSENPNQLDPQFQRRLDEALRDNEVWTYQTLSSSFPADPDEANLAYAQSGSMVFFIIENYGTEAIANLLAIFSEGALYDDALEQALNVNTTELNALWRAEQGLPPLEAADSGSQPAPNPAPGNANADTPAGDSQAVGPVEESGGLALPCLGSSLPVIFLGLGLLVIGHRRRR